MKKTLFSDKYMDKTVDLLAEPSSQKSHAARANYVLNKLQNDPDFEDNSISLLNRVHAKYEATKSLDNEETAQRMFKFMENAEAQLSTKNNPSKTHKLHTTEMLNEEAAKIVASPQTHNAFLLSPAKGRIQKLSA